MKELTRSGYNEISKFLAVGIKIAGSTMKFSFQRHQMPDVVSEGWLKFVKSYEKKAPDCPDKSWAVRVGKFTGQDFVRKYLSKEKPLVSIEELGARDRHCLAVECPPNDTQISIDMTCDFNTAATATLLSQGWGVEEIAVQLDEEPTVIVNKYVENIKNVLKNGNN